MKDRDRPRVAGGYATQRGIDYQNRVAAFFAVSCLADRLATIPELAQSPIKNVRCETGEPLADILLGFEDEGLAFVEVKRSIHLIPVRMKPLISHLIQQLIVSEQGTSGGKFPWRRRLDPRRDRLLLLTSSGTPENVTKDLAACLARITLDTKVDDMSAIPQNKAETEAFNTFHTLTLQAWKDLLGTEAQPEQVVRLYSLFRICALDLDPGTYGEQQATEVLRRSVLTDPSDSSLAWSTLLELMGHASVSRILVTREGLRRELQGHGLSLLSTASYLEDIRALRGYTQLTLASLDHLSTLRVRGREIRIERAATVYLRHNADKQSLVVIGEPGAGKSGVLHELATQLNKNEQDVVFLAADRLESSLKLELGLKHDVADILENWSGDKTGLLIIDALDAARGSNSLLVLRELIRRVVTTPDSRWKVVASIRVFDLRYSQELQQIFRRDFGDDGPREYQDPFFSNIHHIKVPRFTKAELKDIRRMAPELIPIYDSASPALLELLDIPFNLRLVGEMLSDKHEESDFTGIETQVGLLNRYWLNRVVKSPAEGNQRELVLADILRALVGERRLTLSKLRLPHAARQQEFASLCSDNVLVEQAANLHGRYIIGFSHHLLFDYAAARLIVAADWDCFLDSLSSERDLSLFLRPSIDLFFKEAWLKSRDEFWSYLKQLTEAKGVPAIAKIIGPAVIPELATAGADLVPAIESLSAQSSNIVRTAEQWVIHTVGAVLAGVPVSSLELWSDFSEALAGCAPSLHTAAVCQSLIEHILERMKGGESNRHPGPVALSRAAVQLLNRFVAMDTRETWLVARTISNVMDLFEVNPQTSALVLRKLITPEEIRVRGAEQGHWIARKVPLLFDIDPQLASDIYLAFFGYEERSEQQTSMSGSQILALTSSRRQDYHHTRWQLAQHFPKFLEGHFEHCTAIIMCAVNDYIEREHKPRTPSDVITYELENGTHRVTVDYSAIWDGSTVRGDIQNMSDAFFRKLEDLARSSVTLERARNTASILLSSASYAYFPRKVLMVAEKTAGALAAIVYPLLVSDSALISYDLSSVIGETLSTNFGTLSSAQREAIELAILRIPDGATGENLEARQHIRDVLLGCIAVEQLTLPQSIVHTREMSTNGGPPRNHRPFVSHGVTTSSYSEADWMRERGIPIDAEPNASLRSAASRLWDFASRFANTIPLDSDVAEIVNDIDLVRDTVLRDDGAIHAEVRNSSEAQLLAAVATIAKLANLDCTTPIGRKVRTILFSGLDSPEPEHRPEYDAQFDRSQSWGAPVQRIEAAIGVGNLLAHSSCLDNTLLLNVRRVLADPVPAVRFQVAVRLLLLHDRNVDTLWNLLDGVARKEPSIGVLSGVLYAVINPLASRYKANAVSLIETILRRADVPDDVGDTVEWCYRIAAGLYIWQNDAAAYAILREVIEESTFRSGRAAHCLRDIRGALTFVSDVPKETDAQVRHRAFGLLETIIASVSGRMDWLLHNVPVEDRDEEWSKHFRELAQLVDYISNQLYFSSGAYDGTDSTRALNGHAREIFWKESRSAISLLSAVAIPSAAHHLIETLQSFIPFHPAEVFHSIASVVRAATSWGYQYESMAVDLLVNITETYLAEHRLLLQQDLQCREELIDILETFVNAGWPSARRLSYRLEEIFR